ncbi:MAG: SDR family NAD(P)-dependent oxidoreductase [Clostridia bacterium]|nr:SDR family NAD(P)-dependent oxidoreductase [Clostridia bacterium]
MGIALITGASSGIGREFAKQLKENYNINEFWFVARRRDRMEALAAELSVSARIISADLCKDEGVMAVREALESEKPEISVLINAAGFGRFGAHDQISAEDTARMIDLNCKALVLITHMALPYMVKGGHIIEMGSGSCFTPLPNFNVYAASKSFVLHYTKALYYEVKKYGVSATAFCPGWVHTEFLAAAGNDKNVNRPKKTKPLLNVQTVVKGCLSAAMKGKKMFVTNWFTKMQHVLFKILPDGILSRMWLGMQQNTETKKDG